MQTKEKIGVYIDIRKGKTVCICSQNNKMCSKNCARDVVERDRLLGWEKTFQQDRYGHCQIDYESDKSR